MSRFAGMPVVCYSDVFQSHYRPMEPIPTGESPVITRMPGIRAVLFDLYGTLFISGSGEVGTSREAACQGALAGALEAAGLHPRTPVEHELPLLFDTIEASHAAGREAGIPYPEVDIVEVWREVLAELARGGKLREEPWSRAQLERVAVEYEARANPIWPMPGMQQCLEALLAEQLLLGIISNAQFYTRELFPALLGRAAEDCGFDPELQYYSYRHGRAKPGPDLYEMAAEGLGRRGIGPAEALSVGNDMLNDIQPAGQVGFRTALFAGDARSLRLRRGDPRLDGVSPDVVLTSLADLRQVVGAPNREK
ncbi:MAG: HAD family hydrolase [Planctomycetota bacterium]|jgi:putative hydrolase of the HAD superfamily